MFDSINMPAFFDNLRNSSGNWHSRLPSNVTITLKPLLCSPLRDRRALTVEIIRVNALLAPNRRDIFATDKFGTFYKPALIYCKSDKPQNYPIFQMMILKEKRNDGKPHDIEICIAVPTFFICVSVFFL